MKIRSVALRLACWSAFCWLGMTQALTTVHAAKPDFVGSLHLAVDEEGAKLLGLSDETRRAMSELVAKRKADGKRFHPMYPASKRRPEKIRINREQAESAD